jgi:hypothetical protein
MVTDGELDLALMSIKLATMSAELSSLVRPLVREQPGAELALFNIDKALSEFQKISNEFLERAKRVTTEDVKDG